MAQHAATVRHFARRFVDQQRFRRVIRPNYFVGSDADANLVAIVLGGEHVSTATGSLMVPAHPRVLLHMASPRRHRDPAHAARIAGAIYGGALRRQPELAAIIYDRAHAAPVSRRGYAYQLAASAGWTSLPWLRLVRQPTLILAGDDDPIIPLANARLMAALLPDARLLVYRDGPLGLLTRAAELAPLVSDFLLAVETRASPAVQ